MAPKFFLIAAMFFRFAGQVESSYVAYDLHHPVK
jgi:hypothetical protein